MYALMRLIYKGQQLTKLGWLWDWLRCMYALMIKCEENGTGLKRITFEIDKKFTSKEWMLSNSYS